MTPLSADHELVLRALRDHELEQGSLFRVAPTLEVVGALASKLAGQRIGVDRIRRLLRDLDVEHREPYIARRRSWGAPLRYHLTEGGRAKADELLAALQARECRGRVERQPEATATTPTVNPD